MTSQSLGAAFVLSAVVGGLVGWMVRRKQTGSEIAFAVSFLIGVAVLQCSQPTDLLRPFRPAVAADWLPTVVGLAWVAVTFTRRVTPARVAVAVLLATATTARLLWGSVYLRDVSFETAAENAGVLALVAGWTLSIGAALAMQRPAVQKRLDGTVISWALATGLTAATIAMTGSITYGALAGVAGVAALTSVGACGRLPVLAAIPIMSLIGLSVAFSEMPLVWASALLMAWVGLVATTGEKLSTEKLQGQWVRPAVRMAAVCAVLLASGVVASQFVTSSESDTSGYGVANASGYSAPAEPAVAKDNASQPIDAFGAITKTDTDTVTATTAGTDTATKEESDTTNNDRPDPFAGFGL